MLEECPDCLDKVGSLRRHRAICLLRNVPGLADQVSAAERLLLAIEGKNNHSYRAIARYTHVGEHPSEYDTATQLYGESVSASTRLPQLLALLQSNHCQRIGNLNLNASIVMHQTAELRDILARLKKPGRRGQ